jgi:predicted nucleic acid-binding protein
MVIVDTSVLIAYLDDRVTRHTEWLDRQGDLQRIGITSLTQAEILQGIRTEEEFLAALQSLNNFEIFETGSSALAIASARNYRALRKAGVTIRNTIDCLIATFCIENGYELLHNDRDFDGFEAHLGLRVVHPLDPTLN